MRSAVRKAELAIDNNDENTTEVLRKAIKLMDTAARKGLIHKNNASRQKARLTKKAAIISYENKKTVRIKSDGLFLFSLSA